MLSLRSIGFWLGIGLVNYLMFKVVETKFNLSVLDMAWVFSIQGSGAFIGNQVMTRIYKRKKIDEWIICLVGHVILSAGCFLLLFEKNYYIAAIPLFLSSVGSGINMVASQSLRKEIISQQYFAKFVMLELIIGRFSFWAISTIAKISIESGANFETWYISGVIFVLINGILHIKFKNN